MACAEISCRGDQRRHRAAEGVGDGAEQFGLGRLDDSILADDVRGGEEQLLFDGAGGRVEFREGGIELREIPGVRRAEGEPVGELRQLADAGGEGGDLQAARLASRTGQDGRIRPVSAVIAPRSKICGRSFRAGRRARRTWRVSAFLSMNSKTEIVPSP